MAGRVRVDWGDVEPPTKYSTPFVLLLQLPEGRLSPLDPVSGHM